MTADLRQRIADAFERMDAHQWGYDHGFCGSYGVDPETDSFVEAAITEMQPELDRLRAELDRTRAELAEADHHVSPRYWAGFAEHAAIEAIDANLGAARRRLRRHEQYIARLESLRAERAAAVSAPTT